MQRTGGQREEQSRVNKVRNGQGYARKLQYKSLDNTQKAYKTGCLNS